METAGKLFMANGFQAVSMEQIAAAVPVSKPTLYAHFEDKKALFRAVIELRCAGVVSILREGIEKDVGLEEGLRAFGHQFLDLLMSDSSLKFHRVMVAESASFPEMAQMFYETGPQQMQQLLKDFLIRARREKDIVIDDPSLSADVFISMLKGRTHLKCLLGVEKAKMNEVERGHLIDKIVHIFLNGHRG